MFSKRTKKGVLRTVSTPFRPPGETDFSPYRFRKFKKKSAVHKYARMTHIQNEQR